MNKTLDFCGFLLLVCGVTACTPVKLYEDNEPVRLVFFNEVNLADDLPKCTYISPIISSYGNWYNYLFLSNTELAQGAIDDMYNKANEIGANAVYINSNIDFTTSVTLLGQAYRCRD